MDPMLAKPARALPRGADWSYEFKWDGMRALIDVRDGRLRITTRTGNDVTAAYPELAELASLRADVLLDGEIVAFEAGVPSFAHLQQRMNLRDMSQVPTMAQRVPVNFIAFDLLRLDGHDITGATLSDRRALLDTLAEAAGVRPGDNWSVSPAFDDPDSTWQIAVTKGLEGVVAKRLTSRYFSGARSDDWVKVKHQRRDDFVVLGWEASTDAPKELTSLVLGYRDDGSGEWRLAGKVSSGLDVDTSRRLRDELPPVASEEVTLDPPQSTGRKLTWVRPETVVEVGYTEWAADGRLRHPVLLGIRSDKRAADVGPPEART